MHPDQRKTRQHLRQSSGIDLSDIDTQATARLLQGLGRTTKQVAQSIENFSRGMTSCAEAIKGMRIGFRR